MMSDIDWGQELMRVRHEVEELAATLDDQEIVLRVGAVAFARMLIRTGALPPDDYLLTVLNAFSSGDILGFEIGPPAVNYGPCYLHPVAWLGKDDTRRPTEHYQVMVGAIETPIVEMLDVASGKWQATKHPEDAGWLPVATSGLTDVARHLRGTVMRRQAWMASSREWQASHPDHAAERAESIAYAERCIAVWEAGLRALEDEYGAVLATPEANVSAEEQERQVSEIRRSLALLDDFGDYARAQQARSPTPEETIAGLTEPIRRDPNNVEAYYQRGIAYEEQGQSDLALADFDRAIRIDPGKARLHLGRGIALSSLGQQEPALLAFDEAIRRDPDSAYAYCNRALAYRRLRDNERALADFTETLRLDSGLAEAYHGRGVVSLDLGQPERALADFDALVRLRPDDAPAYYARGVAYRELADYDHAVADLDAAIRLTPDYTDAYLNRAYCYAQQGEYVRALADYDTVLGYDPNNEQAAHGREAARRALG